MSPEPVSPVSHIHPNSPLLPVVYSWEIHLQDQGRSPYTIKAFIGDLRLFSEFFPPDTAIGQVTTEDINRFLKWLKDERGVPCSPKSLARRITSIKAFFRWLQKHGSIPVDPSDKVLALSVMSPLPEVLTPDEESRVVEVASNFRQAKKPDARPYTLLALLLTTGIKKGECLAIHLNHISMDSPENPYLFVRYANPQNRFKERKIPLPNEWIVAYNEYLEQYRPAEVVFPWSPRRLEYLLEDIGREAGLEKHLSFDMCRWTCVLNDWRNGVEPETIRQKLGISKIQWREINLKLRKLAEEENGN